MKSAKRNSLGTEEDVRSDLEIWNQELLPKWQAQSGTNAAKAHWQRVRQMCWRGVPAAVRGQVWTLLIGNPLKIDMVYYKVLKGKVAFNRVRRSFTSRIRRSFSTKSFDDSARSSFASLASSENSPHFRKKDYSFSLDSCIGSHTRNKSTSSILESKEHTIADLEHDLPRTFPELNIFGPNGGPYHDNLRELLELCAHHRPDVGYVQGMSYLGGMLLLNMNEYDAFVALATMLHQQFLFDLYRLKMEKVQIYINTFNFFFQQNLKELFVHFSKQGVTADHYYINWCLTLYCRELPLDVVSRIWDNYLLDGEVFCIRTALGILRYYQEKLQRCKFEDILRFFRTSIKDIDANVLFSHIEAMKVCPSDMTILREITYDEVNAGDAAMIEPACALS